MKQIIFGVYAEGPTDYRFFSTLLDRYLTHFCYLSGVEADILPAVLIRGKEDFPTGFIEKMKYIEQENLGTKGLPYIFVHNDSDARTLDRVLDYKWRPWINMCVDKSTWLAITPIRMIESWMLADVEALKSTFIISVENIRQVIGNSDPESIPDPKSKLEELMRRGKQKRTTNFEENLAKRIRLELLEQLPSFQFLKSQIEERIR